MLPHFRVFLGKGMLIHVTCLSMFVSLSTCGTQIYMARNFCQLKYIVFPTVCDWEKRTEGIHRANKNVNRALTTRTR
jgi:hypothetical protein